MAMPSVSGLSEAHRAQARRELVRGVALFMRDPAAIHYSQDAVLRWEGIHNGLSINKDQVPAHSDCSSSDTWLLWNALHVPYGVRDVVNGQDWKAGYTGSMIDHGKTVVHESNLMIGDCPIYGSSRANTKHTTMVIGHQNGVVKVFSHGGEAGPFILDLHYRPDLLVCKRYI